MIADALPGPPERDSCLLSQPRISKFESGFFGFVGNRFKNPTKTAKVTFVLPENTFGQLLDNFRTTFGRPAGPRGNHDWDSGELKKHVGEPLGPGPLMAFLRL